MRGMMKNLLESNVEDLEWYGYDPHAPHPTDIETSDVILDDCISLFTDEETELILNFDVLREFQSFGIDIFIELKNLLGLF